MEGWVAVGQGQDITGMVLRVQPSQGAEVAAPDLTLMGVQAAPASSSSATRRKPPVTPSCTTSQYLKDGACVACAAGTTSAGGNATECTASSSSSSCSSSRATGGTVTTCRRFVIHTFTSNGTFAVVDSTLNYVDVLTVGGGGAGASVLWPRRRRRRSQVCRQPSCTDTLLHCDRRSRRLVRRRRRCECICIWHDSPRRTRIEKWKPQQVAEGATLVVLILVTCYILTPRAEAEGRISG